MQKLLRLTSLLCLAACAAVLVWFGLAQDVRQQSLASTRYDDWDRYWKSGDGSPLIKMPGGLLPSVIPGPADIWGGSRAHSVRVEFHAEPGDYTVELLFNDAHEAAQPLLKFSLNGQEQAKLWVPKGQGRPAPYERLNPALTVRAKIKLDQPDNVLTITNESGSWAAPARLRLLRGVGLYPDKLGWDLLSKPALFWGVLFLLVAAVFLWTWAGRGLARAVASTLLLCVSSLVLFVCAELLFRQYLIMVPQARNLAAQQSTQTPDAKGTAYSYVTMIQPNPDLDIIYNLKPNLDGFFAKYPLRTNSQFMRGPEVALKARPGVMRVMGLGDSVMFGWGVSYEQTVLTIIGQELSQRLECPVESLNLGCPSYNTANEVAVYRQMGRKFKPRLVMLVFMENDFGFPGLMLEPVRPWAVDRSYIARQLRRTLAPRWRDAVADDEQFVSTRHLDDIRDKKPQELTADDRWRQLVSAHYTKTVGHDSAAASLEELSAMLREEGAYGLVVYNPIRITLGEPASYEKAAGFVVQAARKVGLAAVDMTPVYEAYLREHNFKSMSQCLWVGEHDWHPNAIGHALMAKAVMDKLAEKGIIAALARQRADQPAEAK